MVEIRKKVNQYFSNSLQNKFEGGACLSEKNFDNNGTTIKELAHSVRVGQTGFKVGESERWERKREESKQHALLFFSKQETSN